jgi:hypothetical protein
MRTCNECESPLRETDATCPNCGAPAPAAAAAAEPSVLARECSLCGETIAADAEACPACGRLEQAVSCARHPEREAWGQCVICGTATCEECNGGESRAHLCPDHDGIPVIEGWAQVYSTSNDIEAQLLQENLQAEGIDARVLSQKDHFSFTVDLGDLSPVRVLVPAFVYQEAQQTINERLDAQGEVSFGCPNCGEAYDPGEAACAACGAPLHGAGGGGAPLD